MTYAGMFCLVEIRIDGKPRTIQYQGSDLINLNALLEREHKGVVNEDAHNPRLQLWWGGECIAYRELRFLAKGDTVRFKIEMTAP